MSPDSVMNLVSFVLGVIAFVMGLSLRKLVVSRLPPGRLKQTNEALAETHAHVKRLMDSRNIALDLRVHMEISE